MVTPAVAAIVLVRFPFTDLTTTKLRPALVLADASRDDWVLCQITSQPFGDQRAVMLEDEDYLRGTLDTTSYLRPAKLFTANAALMVASVAELTAAAHDKAVRAVVALIESGC